jgi:nucleoside-diphosphate-sugar epimerase
MNKIDVGVLGATSFVGRCLLSLLDRDKYRVTAFSRQQNVASFYGEERLLLPLPGNHVFDKQIPLWICVAPIWVLPDYFDMLKASGVKRIVVLSSTSIFTKDQSSDLAEQAFARQFASAEKIVQNWATENEIEWVIFRPTLIYGMGRDKNISEIIRFIRRFRFFPLLGAADGLRQPVHCEDVANMCVSALKLSHVASRAYNISGGETLIYREMVTRIFSSLELQPRFFSIPLSLFKVALMCLRLFPRYKNWSAAMAERMNRDLVFDHSDATRDLGYKPRSFVLSKDDVSIKS